MFGPRTRLPLRGLIPQVHRDTKDPGQGRFNAEVQSVLKRLAPSLTPSQAEAAQPAVVTASPAFYMSPLFNSTALTVASPVNTRAYACYMGTLGRDVTAVELMLRITTAALTTSFAEIGVATGDPNLGGNPVLTMRGTAPYTMTTTGVKQVTVNATIAAGEAVWAVSGASFTGSPQWRVSSLNDDLSSGMFAFIAGQPSGLVGPQTWTLDTTRPPWWVMRA